MDTIKLYKGLKALPLINGQVSMTMTLKQIAKLAGVSCSTVSRVINNRPGVRPQTRERVLQIVSEYGYEPDPMARSLAFQRSRKIS